MSALRYNRLPEQVPESAPVVETDDRSIPLSAAPDRVPVDAAPPENTPVGNPITQLLPQILETLPNGGEMAQTLHASAVFRTGTAGRTEKRAFFPFAAFDEPAKQSLIRLAGPWPNDAADAGDYANDAGCFGHRG